jgi:hypothetical protein
MEEETRFSDTHRGSLGAGPRLLLRALESCFHEPRNGRGIMRAVLSKLRVALAMPLGTQAQMVLEARVVLKKVTTTAVGESWGECALEGYARWGMRR